MLAFSTPERYRRWLDRACSRAVADPDPETHLVFINAWNEWGEGAYLEPDLRYGYAYIEATKAVARRYRSRGSGVSR